MRHKEYQRVHAPFLIKLEGLLATSVVIQDECIDGPDHELVQIDALADSEGIFERPEGKEESDEVSEESDDSSWLGSLRHLLQWVRVDMSV